MLSIHQDFVDPEPAERQKDVDHTIRCIELAARLGIPAIRLNSGRWNTITSFDDLMKVKGDEPPIPGHTDEDAFNWCIDAIQACLPAAEKPGVMLALENHWGLTTRREPAAHPQGGELAVARHQPRHRQLPGDPYAGIEPLAPHAVDRSGQDVLRRRRVVHARPRLRADRGHPAQGRVSGWVSLEMEGKESPDTAVPKSLALLRHAFSERGGV